MPPDTDRVRRLRDALIRRREPPRSIYWLLIAAGVLYLSLRLGAFGGRPGRLLEDLGLTAFDLAVICYGAGFLLYGSRRTLAGLLWVAALLVFMPFGTVLLVVYWYPQETTFGLLLALLLPTILLVSYGFIFWRYRSSGDGNARQDSHRYAVTESNWLDETVWTLFATRTKRRAGSDALFVLGGRRLTGRTE